MTRGRLVGPVLALLALAGTLAAQDTTSGAAFEPGDRVLLAVEGEPRLSDTFVVAAGPAIELPGIGTISLAGVRRDGIEPYLTDQLGRYLRHAVVHARALIRVEVVGEVARPGFYAMPADALLSDVMMAAGGLTRDAKFAALSVNRDGSDLLHGTKLQQAVAQGRTLDQLGLRSGDALLVPRRHDPESTWRILAIVVTLPVAVFGVTRLF